MNEQILNKNDLYKKENIDFIRSITRIRKNHGLTQKLLEIQSGIKQPMIARIEAGDTIPRVDTVFKLLRPMGYTLIISKVEEKENSSITAVKLE